MRYKPDPDYPKYVCPKCGHAAQQDSYKIAMVATHHLGECDVCRNYDGLTSVRTYGYPDFTALQKKYGKPTNN